MAPEWQRPEELARLVLALRTTEPRPSRRWSALLEQTRRAQALGHFPVSGPQHDNG